MTLIRVQKSKVRTDFFKLTADVAVADKQDFFHMAILPDSVVFLFELLWMRLHVFSGQICGRTVLFAVDFHHFAQ